MRFDLIISNPPYNSGKDLRILQNVYKLGKKICFIHPTSWLFDNKHIYKLYNETRELVKNHFSYHEEIEKGNIIFRIMLFAKLSINVFDKECKKPIDIWEIDAHGTSDIYKNIKKKILSYCKNNNLQNIVTYKNPNNKFEVGISGIRGHQFERYPGDKTHDFFTFIQITDESMHIGNSTRYWLKFLFDTENEAINFKDYLKTKMSRFCLSIYKINQHLDSGELLSVPNLPTYKQKWTDKMISDELNLTNEELEWCLNWIPNYYDFDYP